MAAPTPPAQGYHARGCHCAACRAIQRVLHQLAAQRTRRLARRAAK